MCDVLMVLSAPRLISERYRLERLSNGLLRVFDRASKLSACYAPDGAYAHGDLRAPTLRELLCCSQHGEGEEL